MLTLQKYTNEVLAGPDIVSRGFVYVRESENLLDEAREVVMDALDRCMMKNVSDWGKIKNAMNLGMMAMSYGYVYVAQVAMGANPNQLLKALKEAEAYKGPSLIIAYATCINHGVNMSNPMGEMKKAVDCGYWQLYRFNPDLAEQGKNPFTLDSKEPTGDYKAFLAGETRYASLKKMYPAVAEKLYEVNEQEAKARYEGYKKLSDN